MFPEKSTSLDVFVEVVNPCFTTVINSDQGLLLEWSLEAASGKSSAVFRYPVPTDSVSLDLGTGKDICGSRLLTLRDTAGAFLANPNVDFFSFGEEFEFVIKTYAG